MSLENYKHNIELLKQQSIQITALKSENEKLKKKFEYLITCSFTKWAEVKLKYKVLKKEREDFPEWFHEELKKEYKQEFRNEK